MFRMIIAEDEPRILRNLKEKVRALSSDFKVVGLYDNGEDALCELHWTLPHVILTDIRMPVMDGIKLITEAKKLYPNIQSVIISGYDDFPYLREAIQLGINDYLLKPASDDELAQIMNRLKDKLLLNKSLMEEEIIQQLVKASQAEAYSLGKLQDIANELFYFGNYVIVHAWSPNTEIPQLFQSCFNKLLVEDESITLIPSSSPGELTFLIGVHSWSIEKQQLWQATIEKILQDNQYQFTVTLALSSNGLQPVPKLLDVCKKQAIEKNSFKGICYWISAHALDVDVKQIELEHIHPTLLRFSQFIVKQQKQLFVKEFKLFLENEASSFAKSNELITRHNLEYLLLYISHKLHSYFQDSSEHSYEHKRIMESELIEEVWRVTSLPELCSSILHILESYFFKNEQDNISQRDWAQETKLYIHHHFHENISLGSVADVFQLHPTYLNRVFKRAFQVSIPDYLMSTRMEEACRLIEQHPFMLIKELAEHVGFQDAYYFSKVFKQFTGYSPSDYKAVIASNTSKS